jgi:lipooligosaccharide transport system ATP-binding protein
MIRANQLEKKFGNFVAVKDVDLNVKPGECIGLLGPNGAGKSTIINMIYGVVRRTSGSLSVFGLDPNTDSTKIKKRLGVVTQENALDEGLTVFDNMMVYGSFLGLPRKVARQRVEELLDYMNLSHKKDSTIKALSGGMKRRLVFVRALLGEPELLILDEPTTGLDPAVRHLLWGKVRDLQAKGVTILLTTHYMHEAEVLCDRLVVVNSGSIVAEGSPAELIQNHTPGFVGMFSRDEESKIKSLLQSFPQWNIHQDTTGVFLRAPTLEDITALHKSQGLKPLQIRPANLEDVFLKLTGSELSSDA